MSDSNETRTLEILATVAAADRRGKDFVDLDPALRIIIRAKLDEADPKRSGKPGTLVVPERGAITLLGIDLGLAPGTYDVPVGAVNVLPTVTKVLGMPQR